MVPCIVLAGGLGTRLRSAVPDRPKCLAPVGSQTFLEIQLNSLAAQGINHFVLSLGHLAQQVLQIVATLKVAYRIDCVVEESPLGTGGAALHVLDKLDLNEVLVTNGDTFLGGRLAGMEPPLDLNANERMRMAAVTVDDRSRYGGITLEGTKIVGFIAKGAVGPGLINAGMYRVHRRAFEGFNKGVPLSFETEVSPKLAREKALTSAALDGYFIDIGVPNDYYRFCQDHA